MTDPGPGGGDPYYIGSFEYFTLTEDDGRDDRIARSDEPAPSGSLRFIRIDCYKDPEADSAWILDRCCTPVHESMLSKLDDAVSAKLDEAVSGYAANELVDSSKWQIVSDPGDFGALAQADGPHSGWAAPLPAWRPY